MSKSKTLTKVLRGDSDNNIRFGDLCTLMSSLGFIQRIRGGHHIFTHDGVVEILNLQPRGSKAKAYQVKQVRGVIVAYGLAGEMAADDAASEESNEEKDS
ncbi:MAG: type II toxin-antitoxin system HicA family toxin [Planctomycetes bacterium]|nr:type II toxin-antitoxin system HicA family toxin [Planctomycetota bacterium]